MTAIGLTIVGRVSDISGRRWVFIFGSICGTVGSIVAATAQNVPSLIAGSCILGFAAAFQLSYFYVLTELVPMKYRFLTNGGLYFFQIPGGGTAPLIAFSFLKLPVGWRGVYYLLIAINAIALLSWVLFYHPSTFEEKHHNESKLQYIKNFDYIGSRLFIAGTILFLIGLSWGGASYPWKSSHVIGAIVSGGVSLILFLLWESFAKLKEPLLPVRLFRNRDWVASCIIAGFGGGIYYAFNIIWPQMVAVLYPSQSVMYSVWLSDVIFLMIAVGEICSGFLARYIGHIKLNCAAGVFLGGVFLAGQCILTFLLNNIMADAADRCLPLI